jgi:hypothetical protein
MPFGKRAEGMAVYVILEEQRRVVVVSVTWLELSAPKVADNSKEQAAAGWRADVS